jgi:hypothetical protein
MKPFLLLLIATAAFAQLPNPKLTPGATLKVTREQVCDSPAIPRRRGASVRRRKPLFSKSTVLQYDTAHYEVDHLIALEIGGSNTANNLWPEPYAGSMGAKAKDRLENKLHKMVCCWPDPAREGSTRDGYGLGSGVSQVCEIKL